MVKFFWNYSDTLFPLLALLFLLPGRKGWKGYYLLLTYLIITVILMGFSNLLADRRINNMYLYHSYTLIETGLLLPLISRLSGIRYKAAWITFFLFALFWVANLTFWESWRQFNSNTASLSALLVAAFSFIYFFTLIKTDRVLDFQKRPSFWIVSGLLFYSIASILVLGSYKYKEWFVDVNTHITWKIQQVANMIKFVLFLIGILCSYRQSSPDGSS